MKRAWMLSGLALVAMGCGEKEVEQPEDTGSPSEVEEVEDTGPDGPVDADNDGVTSEADCDDNDPERSPLLQEVCDGKDNDCDGQMSDNELDRTGDGLLDCEPAECDNTAMTWAMGNADIDYGTVLATCHGEADCDAYVGDSACTELRSVLCMNLDDSPNDADHPYWASGTSQLSEPITGCQLDSRETGDAFCAETFGEGYVMADFHMGGGWKFWSRGDWETDQRFVVAIDTQPANCWN